MQGSLGNVIASFHQTGQELEWMNFLSLVLPYVSALFYYYFSIHQIS